MTEVHHGLEGIVAFETEIAEPDKEGSALRYRGVDIEEIVRLEAASNYTTFVLNKDRKIVVSKTLGEYEDLLNEMLSMHLYKVQPQI